MCAYKHRRRLAYAAPPPRPPTTHLAHPMAVHPPKRPWCLRKAIRSAPMRRRIRVRGGGGVATSANKQANGSSSEGGTTKTAVAHSSAPTRQPATRGTNLAKTAANAKKKGRGCTGATEQRGRWSELRRRRAVRNCELTPERRHSVPGRHCGCLTEDP